MQKQRHFHRESGNAVIIVLVVLAIAAVGILAYLSGKNAKDGPADASAGAAQEQQAGADVPELEIKPGNPVVAKVGEQEITRVDVFNFIQTLPPETRQLPIGQIFPVALEQVINGKVIEENTENARLDSDPQVKEQLEAVKKNIVRNVYVQKQVEKKVTGDRVKLAYDQYVENFPDIDEVKARHILVADKAKAKELISELEAGADFAELAKANSTDGTAENGGEIGYFAKTDVVPEFGEAAFDLAVNEYTTKPVETQFGFHVIQTLEKRKRPPATLEQATPFLESQLRQLALNELIQEWRNKAKVERFDINGEAVEPAAGDESQ